MLIAVCVLSPAQLEHVLGFTSFRLRFGGVLRGWYVPRTWFDCVPAGTVLAGTQLFRTRSDKKWCVPRTCSRWNCTENKCERPAYCCKSRTVSSNLYSVLYWIIIVPDWNSDYYYHIVTSQITIDCGLLYHEDIIVNNFSSRVNTLCLYGVSCTLKEPKSSYQINKLSKSRQISENLDKMRQGIRKLQLFKV